MRDQERFTFVFTDIEGSTALLQRFGTEYEEILARHHRVLRAQVAAQAGMEIGTEGDAFFLAFRDSRAAIEMCVGAQLALASETWPPDGTIRIRMGVHRGEARLTEAGWIGLGLHYAARVASTAHGGQVVVGETVTTEALPQGSGLSDLGTYTLKDIGDIRLLQLTHPHLQATFPRLRARPPAESRLPAPMSSFVGRAPLVADLVEQLRRHRMVTLVGSGGIGKTRLALQAVADRRFDDVDLRTFVDLAPLSDQAHILDEIARSTTPDASEQLEPLENIADRSVVLVLDACEHVIEAVADVVESALRSCPNLRILATSRRALGTTGERVIEIGAMDANDAAALLRTRIVDAGGRMVDADGELLHELVTSFEAVPLALELVAPRARTMTLEELNRRVKAEGPLRAASRGRGRRRNLDDEIRWSFELLNADERTILARLSVLVSDASQSLAEAVVAGEDDAIDVSAALEELVAHSMLQQISLSGEPRYRLLETVRAFATRRLAESDEDEQQYQRRYAEAVTNQLERVRELAYGDAPESASVIVTRDRHHVKAALTRASVAPAETALRLVAAHSDILDYGTDPELLAQLLVETLNRSPQLPSRLVTLAEIALAEYAAEQDRDDIALDHGTRAVELAHNHPELQPAALLALGAVQDGDQLRATLGRAVELAREIGDLRTELQSLHLLAFDHAREGELRETADILADVHRRAGQAHVQILQNYALGSLLALNHALGRHVEARRYRDQGLPRWRLLGGEDLVDHLFLAAALACDEGHLPLLEELADEAQLVAARNESDRQRATATIIVGMARASTSGSSAHEGLRAALELPGQPSDMSRFRGRVLLGECELANGDLVAAWQALGGALETPGCLSPDLYARAMEDIAAVSLARGETDDATRRFGNARGHRHRTRCPVQPTRLEFVTSLEDGCRAATSSHFAELVSIGEHIELVDEVSGLASGAADDR